MDRLVFEKKKINFFRWHNSLHIVCSNPDTPNSMVVIGYTEPDTPNSVVDIDYMEHGYPNSMVVIVYT